MLSFIQPRDRRGISFTLFPPHFYDPGTRRSFPFPAAAIISAAGPTSFACSFFGSGPVGDDDLWYHHIPVTLHYFFSFLFLRFPPWGLSAGSEALPAGSEAIPAGSEAHPAGSEAFPAGSKAHPA